MKKIERVPFERHLLVCTNIRPEEGRACCGRRGSEEIYKALKARVKAGGLASRVKITQTKCLGYCEIGANVAVYPENEWFSATTMDDVPALIERFIDPLKKT